MRTGRKVLATAAIAIGALLALLVVREAFSGYTTYFFIDRICAEILLSRNRGCEPTLLVRRGQWNANAERFVEFTADDGARIRVAW